MSKVVAVVMVSALCAGCATSQMKSTPFYTGDSTVYKGKAEDRVNLWPLGYYRDPALSVLWPVFSLTDDHLAVRPLYSQFRQGGADRPYDEFNFLWPFCQVDAAHGRHRVFPVFWGERYFDFFPLVWWEKDEFFNVFPVWWSNRDCDLLLPLYYRDADTFATLLFGWDTDSSWALPLYYKESDCFATLPFVSGGSGDNSYWAAPLLLSWGEMSADKSRNAFLLGLGGSAKEDGKSSQWALPLFYHSDTSLMTLLYGYDRERNGSWVFPCYYNDDDTFLSMVYWRKWSDGGNGRTLSHGTFPFWYSSDEKFLSPFWMTKHDAAKGEDFWFVPPALSWGESDAAGYGRCFALGLCGYAREKMGGGVDWLAPIYYRKDSDFFSLPWCMWGNDKDRGHLIPPLLTYFNTAGDFFTPLCGKSGETNWLLPFWWRDRDGFMTLLYGQNETAGTNPGKEYVFPPLLSGAETHKDGSSAIYAFLGLGAWKNGKDGVFDRSWLFPLWYADDLMFLSIPYQHMKNDFSSVALIAGVRHGERRSGGWLWPLFGWKNDERMSEAEAMLNADTLDPKVTFVAKGSVVNGHTNRWDHVSGTVGASDKSWRLSGLSTSGRSIFWNAGCGKVHGTDVRDFGNVLAFKRESKRTVVFDPKTRKKSSDCETGSSSLLCKFLWASEYEKRNGRLVTSKKSVLWRFWHYEMKDGNVSVDSFPFFTYDAKKDGYEKTSLLWRLFRNEYDPKKSREVDFLFIPVWR